MPGVVYSVHLHQPHRFTHQGVYDNPTGIDYPGEVDGAHRDRDALRRVLQPVIDYQRDRGVQIYIGEFSAIRWAPGESTHDSAIALRSSRKTAGTFPLSDSLLEHARGEQITRFDAFLLDFRKGHRPPIAMQASARDPPLPLLILAVHGYTAECIWGGEIWGTGVDEPLASMYLFR